MGLTWMILPILSASGWLPAYVILQKSGSLSWYVGAIFIIGVAFRLYRFVAVDKKRNDIPEGIFNGLPSPAGALIVLGAALIAPPVILWGLTIVSVGLMVSHLRFAHFGRVILKKNSQTGFFHDLCIHHCCSGLYS